MCQLQATTNMNAYLYTNTEFVLCVFVCERVLILV